MFFSCNIGSEFIGVHYTEWADQGPTGSLNITGPLACGGSRN